MNTKSRNLMWTPFVALWLAACSSSTPSPTDGRRVVEAQIGQQSNGLIKLVSFEKTNGQETDFMGAKGYIMDYKAEIEFLDTCVWGTGGFGGGDFVAARSSPMMFGVQKMQKGQRTTVSGKLGFRKTERGWVTGE
jgi:hypothetical protein